MTVEKLQTTVITGANSGIGRSLAMEYAALSGHVILACRDKIKAEATSAEIAQRYPDAKIEFIYIDLEDLDSVISFSETIKKREVIVDTLILNAGVHIPHKRLITKDGFEIHHQVNFLANVVLVNHLLPSLRQSHQKRVIYVSSRAHLFASFPTSRLYTFSHLYGQSKLKATAFFLHFQELHPALDFYVISPGSVNTNVHRYKGKIVTFLNSLAANYDTSHESAKEIISILQQKKTSIYWCKGKAAIPSKRALNRAWALQLMNTSISSVKKYLSEEKNTQWIDISNYSKNIYGFCPSILTPESYEELQEIVVQAKNGGKRIRAVGSLHSYNDIFICRDILISLSKLDRILEIDEQKRELTCQAGASLETVIEYLDQRGYSLKFAGSCGKQTIAGAISTATHGYYRNGGVLSELISSMTIITGTGERKTITDEEALQALRVSLGTLGIIVELTLSFEHKKIGYYSLKSYLLADFIPKLSGLCKSNQHFRFYHCPFNRNVILTLAINECKELTRQQLTPGSYIDEGNIPAYISIFKLIFSGLTYLPLKRVYEKIVKWTAMERSCIVELNSYLFIKSGFSPKFLLYISRCFYYVFNKNHSHNMELAIQVQDYESFCSQFFGLLDRYGKFKKFSPYMTYRFVGRSEAAILAPNYQRDVLFVDIHAPLGDKKSLPFLIELENLAWANFDIRVHWGKFFSAKADQIEKSYPAGNIAKFKEFKKIYDPCDVFSNCYIKKVLR